MDKAITIRYDEKDGYVLSLSIPGLQDFEATNQVLSLAVMDIAEQLEAVGV